MPAPTTPQMISHANGDVVPEGIVTFRWAPSIISPPPVADFTFVDLDTEAETAPTADFTFEEFEYGEPPTADFTFADQDL